MKILHVVGARPNFMKAAPVMRAFSAHEGIMQSLVHTGQHYDANMSDVFFEQLGLPRPDFDLGVGSGSHAVQTAHVMLRFEEAVLKDRPDLVMVYGDVNSTVAATLVCAKLGIPIAHVEAGLRSFDRTMPEEINRLMTDQIADLLFTPSSEGDDNLLREGIAPERIHCVGNVMIDTLVRLLPQAQTRWPQLSAELGQSLPGFEANGGYALLTLHRPSNVDHPDGLRDLMATLEELAREMPLLFPIHPRTRARLQEWNLQPRQPNVHLMEPVGYIDFLALQQNARLVITDSGGVQEETTFLGVPCLTARENTERPVTVTIGTNILVGEDRQKLRDEARRLWKEGIGHHQIPPLWDGRAGERIAAITIPWLQENGKSC
jgi:UDP-N-acetylglucosamine 2-epimerase (non-hydrolysing)